MKECSEIWCKFCGSHNIIKYGKSGKKQAYLCKYCKRKFVLNEGFEGFQNHPEIIASALDLYFKGLSMRKVAEHISNFYNVSAHYSTVYWWIKRYAQLIYDFTVNLEPELSGSWYADEMCIKVGGKWRWLWNVMDQDTRLLIASVVSSEREVEDARRAFKEARRFAKSKPYEVITDGLHAYEEAVTEFWSRFKDERTEHKRHVRLCGDLTTNLNERLQGTVREKDKVLRGLKKDDSPIIKLMQAYYNFIRRHQGLGKTPAEAAGIGVGSGKHAWLQLMIRSAVHKLVEDRGRLP